MTSNIDTRRLDARRLKKLIEEDRKKDVFEFALPPKTERSLVKLPRGFLNCDVAHPIKRAQFKTK